MENNNNNNNNNNKNDYFYHWFLIIYWMTVLFPNENIYIMYIPVGVDWSDECFVPNQSHPQSFRIPP